jgi:hypothetical protein
VPGTAVMDGEAALAFVESHGVVLVAARGPVPRLTEAVAGEPITGSWWGHRAGHEIYEVLNELTEHPDVLVCRAVGGKVTLVHRRLWPALVRASSAIGVERCARVEQEHTELGHHVNHETPCPQWADADVREAAAATGLDEALDALGAWARR